MERLSSGILEKTGNIKNSYAQRIYSEKELKTKLLDVLEMIETGVDYSQLPNPTKILEITKPIQSTQRLSNIKDKIQNFSVCRKCRSNNVIINKCGHGFCLSCSKDLILNNLGCSQCSEPFSDYFRWSLSKQLPEEDNFRIICKKCKSRPVYLSLQESCGHLCYYCLIESIKILELECFYCHNALKCARELIKIKHECYGCKEAKYLVGDCLSYICSHKQVFCLACIEKILETKACSICNKQLKLTELLKLYSTAYDTCSQCHNSYSNSFLVSQFNEKKKYCEGCLSS
jgi:hypothetical protein